MILPDGHPCLMSDILVCRAQTLRPLWRTKLLLLMVPQFLGQAHLVRFALYAGGNTIGRCWPRSPARSAASGYSAIVPRVCARVRGLVAAALLRTPIFGHPCRPLTNEPRSVPWVALLRSRLDQLFEEIFFAVCCSLCRQNSAGAVGGVLMAPLPFALLHRSAVLPGHGIMSC